MKLITLNIWGGRVADAIPPFFKKYSQIDFFCFQEVFNKGPQNIEHKLMFNQYQHNPNLLDTLIDYLPSHKNIFCQTFQETYGIATFLKKDIEVLHHGETMVARGDWEQNEDINTKDHHRKIQWLELRIKGKHFLLVNAHLTHRPEGKRDSEKRIKQSKTIVDFLSMFDCPKILVGDFNLLPNTESIEILESAGMRNLVKEHGVTCTRTELYKRFETGPKFADYIFVSNDIHVKDFKVLPDIVSDHSPLYLDFDL